MNMHHLSQKITPAIAHWKQSGDIDIKDYVILPRGQDNCLPPRPLIWILRWHMIVSGDLVFTPVANSHTQHSDNTPHPDDTIKNTVRPKILHYRRLYTDRPNPIVFLSLVVSTSDLLSHDFMDLLFLQTHLETVALIREIPESDQFRFLCAVCRFDFT